MSEGPFGRSQAASIEANAAGMEWLASWSGRSEAPFGAVAEASCGPRIGPWAERSNAPVCASA
jgi:hypothetical protein